MKLNIIGSILGSSGYDSHCRQLFNALYKLNSDIKLDVPLSQDYLNHINDAELAAIKKPNRIADVTIGIMTPPFWRLALADQTKKFIGYCVFEGNKIPKYWLEYLSDDRIDQIWCPSEHTKHAILKTAGRKYFANIQDKSDYDMKLMNKIKIVPHGVNIDLFTPKDIDEPNKPFRFLCNKGWRGGMEDRGGVQYVLKAFAEEFSKDEKVELNLHINPAYINPATISQHMDDLKLDKDCPPIKISSTNIPYNKLPALYQSADCYVCATRAEAFDLGTAEAMACKLPVITTAYGGQVEHMDDTCADFIRYELADVKGDLMYEGIKWGVPNVQHLRELMRESFSTSGITREKGEKARKFISDFTWEHTAKKALELINQ